MEEVTARFGWAWEPRKVTPGRWPVMEIAGIDRRLIGWQSTRRQQIEDALSVLADKYEERQGHPPGEKAGCAQERPASAVMPARASGGDEGSVTSRFSGAGCQGRLSARLAERYRRVILIYSARARSAHAGSASERLD
ncbi:hypothetical protein GCM10010497_59080 [Streptomyces cinereoruber]|uniref:TrwC relaxase domain-containing protein n=1 Tax=Streptomyces cinereoruber TaxID=67260 RepID=A0AAV4KT59_9ACTN|nr:hypothetical protein [Streptomyces cinereoruber]NIH65427.1 hypothetical protein [Streptomyces cinereoruber]GGR47897.1 hypothetical protein GCM10010497_59080 [Streptomyces cinereoruber]